jgi:hypothetical protein
MRLVYVCLQIFRNALPRTLTGEVPENLLEMYKIKPDNYSSKKKSEPYGNRLKEFKYNSYRMDLIKHCINFYPKFPERFRDSFRSESYLFSC